MRTRLGLLATASIVLTLGTAAAAFAAAALLSTFVRRPEEVSNTTLLPGLVYASAIVLRVCFATGLVTGIIGGAGQPKTRRLERRPAVLPMPRFALLSVVLPSITPVIGAVIVLAAQLFAAAADGPSAERFADISRVAVFVTLAMIAAGAVSAIVAIAKRERPWLLPLAGLVTNVVLIALFWRFQFYAREFDQDMWAG